LNDLKDWARTEDGADGKDVDENIWYVKTWESEIDKLCKSDIRVSGGTTGRLEDFFSDPPCRDFYMESYIKDQAKKNVSEIVNKGKWYKLWQSDTVTYALEGYDPYTKERKPNSDSMEISQHVQGKAVDLKIDWSRFEGGAWGSEVESLKDKYHLFRPYDQEKDGACSPIKEHWHFELAPVEVKPPDDKSCPYGNGLYCGDGQLDRDKNTLYYCDNGNYDVRERCTNGCQVMDPGENDECKSEQTTCPYGTGLYCGKSSLGQNEDTLYYCEDGDYNVHEQCSNGCEEKPPYVNDVCK
jgi:hypothetical protein